MTLIDTHCHLYSDEFADDIDSIIRTAEETGVRKFYLPSIDSTAIDAMMALEQQYPGKCIAMAGLHPCYVKQN